jgi:hypothetical protein
MPIHSKLDILVVIQGANTQNFICKDLNDGTCMSSFLC